MGVYSEYLTVNLSTATKWIVIENWLEPTGMMDVGADTLRLVNGNRWTADTLWDEDKESADEEKCDGCVWVS